MKPPIIFFFLISFLSLQSRCLFSQSLDYVVSNSSTDSVGNNKGVWERKAKASERLGNKNQLNTDSKIKFTQNQGKNQEKKSTKEKILIQEQKKSTLNTKKREDKDKNLIKSEKYTESLVAKDYQDGFFEKKTEEVKEDDSFNNVVTNKRIQEKKPNEATTSKTKKIMKEQSDLEEKEINTYKEKDVEVKLLDVDLDEEKTDFSFDPKFDLVAQENFILKRLLEKEFQKNIKEKSLKIDSKDKDGVWTSEIEKEKKFEKITPVKSIKTTNQLDEDVWFYQNSKYIFSAISDNNIGAVDAILKRIKTTEVKNKMGDTPLLFAVRLGRVSIVEFLLLNGANKNIRDEKGLSAIDIAKKNKRYDIENILINTK